jgi:hypothetical protein
MAKALAEDRKKSEMALTTVMMLVERASLVEAQERLNAYLPPEERLQVAFGSVSSEGEIREARAA